MLNMFKEREKKPANPFTKWKANEKHKSYIDSEAKRPKANMKHDKYIQYTYKWNKKHIDTHTHISRKKESKTSISVEGHNFFFS